MTATTPPNDTLARYREALIGVFGTPQRVLVRGEGCRVWDDRGREYLDLLAGIAVNALGHGHPALVDAISQQARRLVHVSNFFTTPAQVALAEALLDIAAAPAGSGVFLANSGAEANEAAFKLARRTGKPRILALSNAFHGRTMGSLALTWKEAYRAPFEPLPGGVEWIPAGDAAAAQAALAGGDVAAVFAEPIQGEAGVLPLEPDYLRTLRDLTRAHGTLLILDEVQTGIARTGHWFAHQAIPGVQPDVMTLAKGLGGGVPIGAVVAYGENAAHLLGPGQHGTTFGGNPLACAAALAVLCTIREENLLAAARARGDELVAAVGALDDERILGVRGAGLLRGIALRDPIAPQAVTAALDVGIIINAPDARTLRIAPPLVISAEELAGFVRALPGILDRAEVLGRAREADGERA